MLNNRFYEGFKSAIPIAAGYFPVAVSFGLTAVSAGLDGWLAVLMSVIVFAGASQFVAAGMFGMGVGGWEIVLTTFVLNFRHFLMSSSLSKRIDTGAKKMEVAGASFGITDETFAMASMSGKSTIEIPYLYGLNFTAYVAWCGGTVVGVMAGAVLTETLKQSLAFGLYALFIGLLIPEIKKSRPAFSAAFFAIICSGVLYYQPFIKISSGWIIVLATIFASLCASIIHGEQE